MQMMWPDLTSIPLPIQGGRCGRNTAIYARENDSGSGYRDSGIDSIRLNGNFLASSKAISRTAQTVQFT